MKTEMHRGRAEIFSGSKRRRGRKKAARYLNLEISKKRGGRGEGD